MTISLILRRSRRPNTAHVCAAKQTLTASVSRVCVSILLAVAFVNGTAWSQQDDRSEQEAVDLQARTAADPFPLQGPDTTSPRAMLRSFLAATKQSYELAKQEDVDLDQSEPFVPSFYRMDRCLDGSQLPTDFRERGVRRAAVCLKEVLDRISLPDFADIPDGKTSTSDEDQLSETAVRRWTVPRTEIHIDLVEDGPRRGEYLFSSDAVARAAEFYERVEHLPYLPEATEGFFALYLGAAKQRAVEQETSHPLAGAYTTSPRATLSSFLEACNEAYNIMQTGGWERSNDGRHDSVVNRIERCLDDSKIPPAIKGRVVREAAVCLKETLDRIELPPIGEIPDKKMLEAEGIDRWTVPQTEITIAAVQEGPRRGEFLFSPDTVVRAKRFYTRVKRLPYQSESSSKGFYDWFLSEPGWMIPAELVHAVPVLDQVRFYDQTLWQWLGLGLALIGGLIVIYATYRVGMRRASVGRRAGIFRYWITLWFPIAAMAIPLFLNYFATEQLRISGNTLIVVKYLLNLGFVAAAIVVVMAVGNRIAEAFISSPQIHPKGVDAQLIRLVAKFVSLIAAAAIFLEGGRYLGIPLSTLLAGAGVGGLALALAAQDTIKNLFGSIMIVLDKPFQVGERIITNKYDGVVEEIGLRSTKLRLLTGHLAAIPNEELARRDIENVGRRRHIRRTTDIAIRLDTTTEKAREAVDIVRQVLHEHEGMEPDFPPRVYLNEFNRDSLNIRMIYWYHPPDYWDYLAFGQRVNLQIKDHFEAAGIDFALPATTTFLAQDEKSPPGDAIARPDA